REATGQVPPSAFRVSERHIYGSSRIGMDVTTYDFISTTYTATNETTRTLGHKQYEISNHLGNVLSVITDQKLPEEAAEVIVSYSAVIITATDYSPFGVGLYGRSWSEGYRYGFNGKEEDQEITELLDFGARLYNTRLGKWLATDPLLREYPMLSSYQYSGNNPVFLKDPDGKKIIPTGDGQTSSPEVSSQVLHTYFTTAFGVTIADLFMSSDYGGGLGAFSASGNTQRREKFAADFNAAIASVGDDYLRSLAIGVYETIMSDQIVSFVAYTNNQGVGQSTRGGIEGVGKHQMNDYEDYHSLEPMVLGTPGLRNLQNQVDVLYDEIGPGNGGNRNLSSALVAASDGLISNSGGLDTPQLSMNFDPTGGGYARMASQVCAQLVNANRALKYDVSSLREPKVTRDANNPTTYMDRQGSVANEHNYFNNVARQCASRIRNVFNGVPNNPEMSKEDRRALDREHRPGRTNFTSKDGN
ncbi:MAG: RHS repeat-associated core domain-containing protein, partial [Pseudomonadota bacterium]